MQTRHYTYLMICQETKQLYIGVRSSKVDPKTDKYQSSSAYIKKMICSGYTFKKRVLSEFSTRSEAVLHEIYLHSKYDVARSNRFLNRAKSTAISFDRTGIINTTDHIEKVRRKRLEHFSSPQWTAQLDTNAVLRDTIRSNLALAQVKRECSCGRAISAANMKRHLRANPTHERLHG